MTSDAPHPQMSGEHHYYMAASAYHPTSGAPLRRLLWLCPKFGTFLLPPPPRIPLRIVELCGGLAIGLEALLRVGYAISSYA
jgi:hypothetical protein